MTTTRYDNHHKTIIPRNNDKNQYIKTMLGTTFDTYPTEPQIPRSSSVGKQQNNNSLMYHLHTDASLCRIELYISNQWLNNTTKCSTQYILKLLSPKF